MREKICGIYLIQNSINLKTYIGSSSDIYKRWVRHKYVLNNNCHENEYLQRAWNKYHNANFKFIILLQCDNLYLIEWEQFFIDCFKSFKYKFGYNIIPYANRSKLSFRTRKKISKAHKGKIISMETRCKMSLSRLGKVNSEETRKRISHSNIGKHCGSNHIVFTEEIRKKMSDSHKGRKKSEEFKKKASERMKKSWSNGFGKNLPYPKWLFTEKIFKENGIKRRRPLLQFDLNGNFIKEFSHGKQISLELGIKTASHAFSCAQGKRKTAYGYIWKYKNP